MTVKIFVLALTLCVSRYSVSGASYSKVYVQRGQEIIPAKYVQYGAPEVSISGPQTAPISAAPVDSPVVPVASSPNIIPPCGTPCVYTGPAISSVPQTTPNFVTYKSNIPVVPVNGETPTSYEYSYVVYDEDTGDHKAQHEKSDGSVVRGQYSLIQPDGYVREVHYTADDLSGFNAVVKKFLPANVVAKHEHTQKDNVAPPSHEANHELPTPLGPNKKHEGGIEPHNEVNNVMHTTNSSDVSHNAVNSEESLEHTNEESHESGEEHPHQPPKEAYEKPSEALTDASSNSSEEKELLKDSSEEHEHTGHEIEPHQEQDDVAQDNNDIHHETSIITKHEAVKDASYHYIIKCLQTAINSKDQIAVPLTYIMLDCLSPC